MAVTTEKATQETNRTANPPVMNPSYNTEGRIRFAYFAFTQGAAAGDAGSLANLVTLPRGNVRLLKNLSLVRCSAFGASRVLDIGYLAHTKIDGTAVNASADTILDGGNIASATAVPMGAGTNALGTTDPTILFDSRDGVTLQAKVTGGTIPAGATLNGFFAYTTD